MINRRFSSHFGLVAGAVLFLGACSTTGDTLPVTEVAPAAPSTPVFAASDIMGSEARAIDGLLGSPTLSRQEGEGEYRRYALNNCVLIVILYPDEQGRSRAVHLDAIAQNSEAAKPDLNACLAGG